MSDDDENFGEDDCTIYNCDGVHLFVVPMDELGYQYRASVDSCLHCAMIATPEEEKRLYPPNPIGRIMLDHFRRYPEEQARLRLAMLAVGWLDAPALALGAAA